MPNPQKKTDTRKKSENIADLSRKNVSSNWLTHLGRVETSVKEKLMENQEVRTQTEQSPQQKTSSPKTKPTIIPPHRHKTTTSSPRKFTVEKLVALKSQQQIKHNIELLEDKYSVPLIEQKNKMEKDIKAIGPKRRKDADENDNNTDLSSPKRRITSPLEETEEVIQTKDNKNKYKVDVSHFLDIRTDKTSTKESNSSISTKKKAKRCLDPLQIEQYKQDTLNESGEETKSNKIKSTEISSSTASHTVHSTKSPHKINTILQLKVPETSQAPGNLSKIIPLPVKSLFVSDSDFFKQPGVIGNYGVPPKFTTDICVAIDCEMVGIENDVSMLARVSIVDMSGQCIYDTYVAPVEKVVNYRTSVSGILPEHINSGASFYVVRHVVSTLVCNRILIGHALHNDLSALKIKLDKKYIRDTSYYRPFKDRLGIKSIPKLKVLAKKILDMDIQEGEHDSIIDAQATMALYMKVKEDWESFLLIKRRQQRRRRRR